MTSYSLCSRRRAAAQMLCLQSSSLLNILQGEDPRFNMASLMRVRHLTRFCTVAFKKNCSRKNVPVTFVRILYNWCSNLHCSVRWNNIIGESFVVKCGVRQGEVLSPYLFALYMDELMTELRQSNYGLHIGQQLLAV